MQYAISGIKWIKLTKPDGKKRDEIKNDRRRHSKCLFIYTEAAHLLAVLG